MSQRNLPESPAESSPLSQLSRTPSLPELPEINQNPHKQAHTIYIPVAKCDNCNTAGSQVLQKCSSFSIQLCRACVSVWESDGIHNQREEVDWDQEKASKRKASSRAFTEDASFASSSEDPARFSAGYPSSGTARERSEYMMSQKQQQKKGKAVTFEEDYEEEEEEQEDLAVDLPQPPVRRFPTFNYPQPPWMQNATPPSRVSSRNQTAPMGSMLVPHTETLAAYRARLRDEKTSREAFQKAPERANNGQVLPSIEIRAPTPTIVSAGPQTAVGLDLAGVPRHNTPQNLPAELPEARTSLKPELRKKAKKQKLRDSDGPRDLAADRTGGSEYLSRSPSGSINTSSPDDHRRRIRQVFSSSLANLPPPPLKPSHHYQILPPIPFEPLPLPRPRQQRRPVQHYTPPPQQAYVNVPSFRNCSMPSQEHVNRVIDTILEHNSTRGQAPPEDLEPPIQRARARAKNHPHVQNMRKWGRDQEAEELIDRVCLYYKINLS